MTAALRLTGRRASHFTRVARMVAHELAVPLELEVLPDLLSLDPGDYGGHPSLKIPTLHVGGVALFGTDNICRRLAELAGRAADPRIVLGHQLEADLARSAQELAWHAMAAQVQLVLGVRVAGLSADNAFFVKVRRGMLGALAWLDAHLDPVLAALPAPRDLSVLEVALYCVLDHVAFRPTVSLDGFPRLRGFAAAFAARPSARDTAFCVDLAPTPKETP